MDGTEVEVKSVRNVGAGMIALEIESPPGFNARPGQFLQVAGIVDGEEITRHYTLSSPTATETFEITVGIDPDGDLSPWLAEREAGDTVSIAGPFGRSYYEGEARVIVLAGGPGIGPAVGIGERALADGNDATIVYRDDEPAHEDRLRELEADGATVVLTEEAVSESEEVRTVLSRADGRSFVYGFADFLSDALDVLAATGHDPDEAKTENFG
ncbi:oxidoreductase [Haladaptatus sp. W1]|uniref:FAD-dependent oxidoreductase n=1 Tax=Haladaptatus sp. W1 TaxID=1897478 RepID=UPI000849767F|nr:FAD-dependent oxidoreductase [Haladaptatus sp. W1]ODR80332.1 oxidoreductase [Haladaptatus sp. W1]ODR83556.1 oxidoreductase [Haladaptatus sp. W1]